MPASTRIVVDAAIYLASRIDNCQYRCMSKRPPKVRSAGDADVCRPTDLATPLAEPQAKELARAFAALADPARLRLFSLIAGQPADEVCACSLAEPLGRSQPTVSHHLRVLYEAGLVDRERRGTWVWYRVVPSRLEALTAALGSVGIAATAASRSWT